MENKLSSILVMLLIALIALTSYWLKLEVIKELRSEKSLLASGPDFYLDEFSAQQTTENGDIKFILDGKKMTNYEHLNKTYLKNPKFTKYENGNPYSWITGKNGEITNLGDEIIVRKNVILMRLATSKKKAMKLSTDSLNILPNSDIIFTRSPVKMIQEPNIEISGVGMKFDKKENTFKLLGDVRVHYEKIIK
jgi:lipopolysaccharide export system protein LptC